MTDKREAATALVRWVLDHEESIAQALHHMAEVNDKNADAVDAMTDLLPAAKRNVTGVLRESAESWRTMAGVLNKLVEAFPWEPNIDL